MKLIKYSNSLCIGAILFVTGCCTTLDTRKLTPFPPKPLINDYTKNPVISYDAKTETFIVTKEMVNNTVQYKIYTDAIHQWKTQNGIE